MLDKLLALVGSVTTWTRAGIVIVLGAAALVGTIIYQAQDRFIAAFEEFVRSPPRATVHAEAAQAIAQALLRILPDTPSAVLVWTVDLEANHRWLVGFATDDPVVAAALQAEVGRHLRAGYPVLRAVPGANTLFIGALNGMVACGPPVGTPSEERLFTQFRVHTLCVIGIPPEAGQFVGLLTAGFSDVLAPELVEQVRPLFWQAAKALAGRADGPILEGDGKETTP